MKIHVSLSGWRFCLLSAITGALLGGALELARSLYNDYQNQRTIEEFEPRGMSPPLAIDLLHWWALPVWTAMIFMVGGFLIY